MSLRDDAFNEAIDELTRLTGEDFHGYRSEVWNVLARFEKEILALIDEHNQDKCHVCKHPSERETY